MWVAGDGAALCAEALRKAGADCVMAPEHLRWQSAWGVARAAAGRTPAPAEDLLPVYLRLSQAERERQEKMENPKN